MASRLRLGRAEVEGVVLNTDEDAADVLLAAAGVRAAATGVRTAAAGAGGGATGGDVDLAAGGGVGAW